MTARYREIARQLRRDIEAGCYAPGTPLPGIADLSQLFAASRVTIRHAIAVLERQGLVRVVQGRGTEVVDRAAVPVRLSRYAAVLDPGQRGPWETACDRAGVVGHMAVVDVDRQAAPADVAAALDLPPSAPVIRRDRHATIDDQVVQLQSAWYPLALVAGTPLGGLGKVVGGAYAALVAAGVQLARPDETVSARAATDEEAAELRLRLGAPVLTIERLTRDVDGQAVELLRVVANPARTALVYDHLPWG